MDFRDTPEEASFRADLRDWFAANLPADWAARPPQVGRYSDDEALRVEPASSTTAATPG